ncbi:MAG: L-threonylcarbamoyladenylate synthase [Candidatus Moranbacteria bacterium]|nr:L-threonylcarbamoyladenylate synthase [Candidatus Moranbacteria bacterium]
MLFSDATIRSLREGKLTVIPTDTLYGIVCSARDKEAVEKLYRIRGRDTTKPCIILLADISGLREFGIVLSKTDEKVLNEHWPGKVSVVFDCAFEYAEAWAYLHRGTKTLAFRVPDDEELQSLLRSIGPLLAPSANMEGQSPAHTVADAKAFFGDQITVYVDGGYRDSLPSTVARLRNGVWEVLREGATEL